MKKIVFGIALLSIAISCAKKETGDLNAAFDSYKNNYINETWKLYPEYASAMGYHKYDSILTITDDAFRQKSLSFAAANLDSLKKYDLSQLNTGNVIDYKMIKNNLESSTFEINEVKGYEWDPSSYNVSNTFAEMLNGTYDSLSVRLRNFNRRLKYVPSYYAAAKKNIKNPTAEHLQLAIDQNTGGLSIFETEFKEAVIKSAFNKEETEAMLANAAKSAAAIKDYIQWLKDFDNKTPRSFRLGEKLYAKKFDLDIQADNNASAIYNKAVARKDLLHDKMFTIANKLWTKYMGNAPKPQDKLTLIRQVIDKISLQHTTPELFQSEIEKQIPQLVAFIKEKDLIYIDPSKPLVVRKEPEYMAGVAGASISSPGPYDKNANTYYNVGSLSGWTAEQAESYLREYNNYTLQVINIHEAIPGHYTQLVYSNQSPSIIKSVFGNSTMIEGWAVYTELMMLENGYANSDEMWLMYYKWNLRSVCNTILDISVHTKNMSKEDALKLLVTEAFQQQQEADGKWKRVTLINVQLCCYFTGFSEIYDLREIIKKKEGKAFNLKKFHEKFLSYGSAPVKYIKELMLNDKK
jgi:uncharacterized protein (DUF885 family)